MKKFEKPTWTQVPNLILEEVKDFTETEIRVILIVIRYTAGFHRRTWRCSLTKLQTLTGLSRKGVWSGSNTLEEKGLIQRIQDGGVTIWSLNIVGSSGHTCPLCGINETLWEREEDILFHTHHILPKEFGGDDETENLITICDRCHKELHSLANKEIADGQEPTKKYFKALLGRVMKDSYPDMGVKVVSSGNQSKPKRFPQETKPISIGNSPSFPEKPPSTKESIKEKDLNKNNKNRGDRPPAVELCKRIIHRYPHKSLWKTLDRKIGREFGSLLKWGRLLRHWKMNNWNVTNYKDMLDAFSKDGKKVTDYDSAEHRRAYLKDAQ